MLGNINGLKWSKNKYVHVILSIQKRNAVKAEEFRIYISFHRHVALGWSKRQQFQDRKQHLLASHRQQQFKQQRVKAKQTYIFNFGNSIYLWNCYRALEGMKSLLSVGQEKAINNTSFNHYLCDKKYSMSSMRLHIKHLPQWFPFSETDPEKNCKWNSHTSLCQVDMTLE